MAARARETRNTGRASNIRLLKGSLTGGPLHKQMMQGFVETGHALKDKRDAVSAVAGPLETVVETPTHLLPLDGHWMQKMMKSISVGIIGMELANKKRRFLLKVADRYTWTVTGNMSDSLGVFNANEEEQLKHVQKAQEVSQQEAADRGESWEGRGSRKNRSKGG